MAQLFPEYPETVFRFRPYNSLSLKELQYGEVFFIAKDELNDPYDTKNPAFFENNYEIYKRLIFFVLNPYNPNINSSINIDVNSIAKFLSKNSLLQDELIELLNSEDFKNITIDAFSKRTLSDFALTFIRNFKQHIHNAGGICYIASFSKKNNDPVMWSHYSNHHKGFCLCFTIQDEIFSPDKLFNSEFFKECKFEEVCYNNKNVTINGFYLFPKFILGENITEDERQKYWSLRKKSYLTKYKSWDYEQEVRIIVDDWADVKSSEDGVIKKTISDRIFYYDQQQLTGIIFGSKMNKNEQTEIRSIIYKMRGNKLERDNIFINGRFSGSYLPIFIFYQAKESSLEFQMNIEPIDGLDSKNCVFQMNELEIKKEEYTHLRQQYLTRISKMGFPSY